MKPPKPPYPWESLVKLLQIAVCTVTLGIGWSRLSDYLPERIQDKFESPWWYLFVGLILTVMVAIVMREHRLHLQQSRRAWIEMLDHAERLEPQLQELEEKEPALR
jgi:hypothetical protein